MSTLTIITVAFSLAILATAWIYSYLAWVPFFTFIGTKKRFEDVSRKSLLRFLLPGALLMISITILILVHIENSRTASLLTIATLGILSILGSNIFFFLKWKKLPDPMEIPLEQFFKNHWSDIRDFSIPKNVLMNDPILRKDALRLAKYPHAITEFVFYKDGVDLVSVRLVYLSYLDSLGHKALGFKEIHGEQNGIEHFAFYTSDSIQRYCHVISHNKRASRYSLYSEAET